MDNTTEDSMDTTERQTTSRVNSIEFARVKKRVKVDFPYTKGEYLKVGEEFTPSSFTDKGAVINCGHGLDALVPYGAIDLFRQDSWTETKVTVKPVKGGRDERTVRVKKFRVVAITPDDVIPGWMKGRK